MLRIIETACSLMLSRKEVTNGGASLQPPSADALPRRPSPHQQTRLGRPEGIGLADGPDRPVASACPSRPDAPNCPPSAITVV